MAGLKALAALCDSTGARDARLPQRQHELIRRVRSSLLTMVSDNIGRGDRNPEIVARWRRERLTAQLVQAGDTFGELADALETQDG